jgi:hypothetical protein
MVEEREVHDRVVQDFYRLTRDLPRLADAAPAATTGADAVDDMLF